MIKRLMFAAVIFAAAVAPSHAKNYALPDNNPIATVVIPDSWDVDEIEFGYSAVSPDEDVIFSIETASAARVDKMIELNLKWMRDQEIVPKGKAVEEEVSINGVPAKIYSYKATDPDGDTVIEFVLLPGANNRVILLTLWATDEARAENNADIGSIIMSIKPIN